MSHYPDSTTYHSKLIQLVAKFRREYSLDLIMDSYCETGVAELGIARWCQMQLSESTRVLMVISREYLEVSSCLIVALVASKLAQPYFVNRVLLKPN